MADGDGSGPPPKGGMSKSMHVDVPDWESCCATPEPYWQEAFEQEDGDGDAPDVSGHLS